MRMLNDVSVIIPCYNDGYNLEPIIKEVKKINEVKEIIVVDDGSNVLTKKYIEALNEVKVITHDENQGKSRALKNGFVKSRSQIVVFLDADLVGLNSRHIRLLINPIIKDDYDMVISDREKEIAAGRFLGYAIMVTGDRAFKREVLEKNIEVFNVTRYFIEVSFNRIFFHKYKTAKVLFDKVGQKMKYKKFGIKGVITDLLLILKFMKFLGINEFFYQLIFSKKLKYWK